MPRPELLARTYESFQKHIPWLDFKKCKLFINVDDFPQNVYSDILERHARVLEIGREYFKEVVSNKGFSSFPKAVKWIFSQVDSEYVFNLEDDWELLCDIPDYIPSFFDNPDLVQVGFRAWKKSDPRFVLSPSILKASFCKFAADNMNVAKNPEQQIRDMNPYKNRMKECFIYWPYESEKIILRDLGRVWMKGEPFGRGMDDWKSWNFLPNPITRAREQSIWDQNADIDLSKLDGNFGGPSVSAN